MPDRRPRGVRLGDLDRSLVYAIGYVGRRWEILSPIGHAGHDVNGSEGADGKRSADGPSPRHAAPESLT